jgi:hypothetical protein
MVEHKDMPVEEIQRALLFEHQRIGRIEQVMAQLAEVQRHEHKLLQELSSIVIGLARQINPVPVVTSIVVKVA